MKFLFGSKKSEDEKAQEQALKARKKAEQARLKELKKLAKTHDALARKTANDEKKRVKREEKEWKKQEKALRDREKQEQRQVEQREKEERKRVKKLERQHATRKRREERRRRKELMRNRRKMKKLRKQMKKQRRGQDAAAHQRQIDELLATESERSPQPQDPETGAFSAPTPEFAKRPHCFMCKSKFKRLGGRRRHHCRNCGESCCKKCVSEAKHAIPWQGKRKPQKVCMMCDTLVFSDRTAASLAVGASTSSGAVVTESTQVASRSNSTEAAPEAEPAPSSSSSSRPASGSGISVSLSSRSNRLRRNESRTSTLSRKPSIWMLPIRPLLKRKRSVERLRNRQMDFELQLEKAEILLVKAKRAARLSCNPSILCSVQSRLWLEGGRHTALDSSLFHSVAW